MHISEYLFTQPKPININNNIRFWHDIKGPSFTNNVVTISSYKDEKVAIKAIDDVKKRSKKLSGLTEWWVTSQTKPRNMSMLLKQRSFSCNKKISVLISYCNKETPTKSESEKSNSAIEIRRFTDISLISKWDSILAESSNRQWPTTKERIKSIELNLNGGAKVVPRKEYFAGYYDNYLASTGCLLIMGSYTYLYNIATDPKFRKKGLATAMTKALVARAQELNLNYVLLLAQQGSAAERLYINLGFDKVFDIEVYRYPNCLN